MNTGITIYSSLTESIGHLLLDDLFWIDGFTRHFKNVDIYTSRDSINNIKQRRAVEDVQFVPFKDSALLRKINFRLFYLFRVFFAPRIKDKLVLIQGFEEFSILIFLLRQWRCRNKYILVLTNNISLERFHNSGRLLTFLLNRIFNRVDYVFYHSDFELTVIKKYLSWEKNADKLIKVKYHLIGKQTDKSVTDYGQRGNIISFYGPSNVSKPIDEVIRLVNVDKHSKYKFIFYKVTGDYLARLKEQIDPAADVEYVNAYLSDEEYADSLRKSRFVFLPHNYLFEGKLSGILADCIASRTPMISRNIHPVKEYFENYGDMGYLYEENNEYECFKKVLEENHESRYVEFQESMTSCFDDHDDRVIMKEIMTAIEN